MTNRNLSAVILPTQKAMVMANSRVMVNFQNRPITTFRYLRPSKCACLFANYNIRLLLCYFQQTDILAIIFVLNVSLPKFGAFQHSSLKYIDYEYHGNYI